MPDTATDDTARMLRESVATFTARESDLGRARRVRREEHGFSRAVWRRMGENGWLGMLVPEQYGGLGLGLTEATVVLEELGGALVPEPVAACAVLAPRLVARGDDEAFKREALSAIVEGATVSTLAWQERVRRYAPAEATTRAEGGDGEVHLLGEKRFVVAADSADAYLVSAMGGGGLGLYWVERQAAGLDLREDSTVDGTALGTLAFDRTPARALTIGDGVGDLLAGALDEARVCVSAELVGVMQGALDLTLEYVKQREQFGQAIGRFQALQHRLVDLWIQTELARASVARAVRVFDSSTDPRRRAEAASAAKARCSEAALLVTRQGIQLHGAIGYTDACDIGLFLKRALVLSGWLGNASAERRRFAAVTTGRRDHS